MREIKFYGSSDDLIEVSGAPGADEFYADSEYDNPNRDIAGLFIVGGKMMVTAIYGKTGCWSFAVGQFDESIPLPDWKVSIRQHENGYSTELTIEAPDDTTIARISQ